MEKFQVESSSWCVEDSHRDSRAAVFKWFVLRGSTTTQKGFSSSGCVTHLATKSK